MRFLFAIALCALLGACQKDQAPKTSTPIPSNTASSAPVATDLTIYRAQGCSCCEKWVSHIKDNGFKVKEEVVADLFAIKSKYHVAASASSCHTSVVDGYVIEGHVPAADIKKLLAEKPQAIGLFLPGMPIGSPGMEVEGKSEPYTVWLVNKDGSQKEFAKH